MQRPGFSTTAAGAPSTVDFPPLLSASYEKDACACAAELLHVGLKCAKLETFCEGVAVRSGLPGSLDELCELLLALLLSGGAVG